MNQVAKKDDVVEDPQGEAEFAAAFEEVAATAELSPEEQVKAKAAAEEAARKAALEAETPEAKKAREDAEAKVKADAEEKARQEALANETAEAKLARETAEKEAAEKARLEAEAKAKADAEAKARAEAEEKARKEAEAKAAQETPEAKAAREAYEASLKPYEPTEAEVKALAQFEKDFPNEYAAMQARLKGVDREVNAKVHAALAGVMERMGSRLTAVEAVAGNTALDRHLAALHTAHADYDAVIVKVPAWIKSQPAYLQPAMQAAYDEGTTEDVIALVSDFKKATGVTTTTNDDGAAEKARLEAARAAEAKEKARQEAAALRPVGSRRSVAGPKGEADKNDYDGAFAEVAAAFEGAAAAKK